MAASSLKHKCLRITTIINLLFFSGSLWNHPIHLFQLLYSLSDSAPSSPHSHPSTPPMPPSSVSTEKPSNFSAGQPYNPHPSDNVYQMEVPHCDRCRNHGLEFPLKGHKPNCPHRNCQCHKCMLNMERKYIQTEIRQEKHQSKLFT